MSDKTHISWSDATWPVARGCDKISPGCKGCWAIKDANRMQHNPNPKVAAHFEGLTIVQGGKANWSGVVRLDESILDWPFKWRKSRNIFVASSGDLFHELMPTEAIGRVFVVMQTARIHRYQVLTKRSSEALSYLRGLDKLRGPMAHVHIGFSAENQACFDARWEDMREIAKLGWLVWCSYEPALGPVNMRKALGEGLSWVVTGGESGAEARPMHPDWARDVRDACVAAKVPFHFKQWGEFQHGSKDFGGPMDYIVLNDGRYCKEQDLEEFQAKNTDARDQWAEMDAQCMGRVGKKAAGRLLDGREWNEFPG